MTSKGRNDQKTLALLNHFLPASLSIFSVCCVFYAFKQRIYNTREGYYQNSGFQSRFVIVVYRYRAHIVRTEIYPHKRYNECEIHAEHHHIPNEIHEFLHLYFGFTRCHISSIGSPVAFSIPFRPKSPRNPLIPNRSVVP